jgi:hypothetical protein
VTRTTQITGNSTGITTVQCNTGEKAVGGGVGEFTDSTLTTPIINKSVSIAYPINASGNPVPNGGIATGWAGANDGGLSATNVTVIFVTCSS